MLKGFRDFILRGNVVDMAIGIIIGAAFNSVVSAVVADVFNPLIASTIGKPDLSSVIFHVNGGEIKIGAVVNTVIAFLIVAAAVYFGVVVPMNYLMKKLNHKPLAPPAKKTCPECLSEIPAAARRCAQCGQPQPSASIPAAQPAGD